MPGLILLLTQNLTLAQQKTFVQRIGELSGKPRSSGLSVHPLFNSPNNEPMDDEENFGKEGLSVFLCLPSSLLIVLLVYVISNKAQVKLFKEVAHRIFGGFETADAAKGWHTE